MKSTSESFKDYVESGKYYSDARKWYSYKYVHPFSQRSLTIILSIIAVIIFTCLTANIYKLFPVIVKVKYIVNADESANKSTKIIKANQIPNNPSLSVTDLLIKNYVTLRENYDYDNLRNQFIFIKNNSTRIVFNRFFESMNIDNPKSPVMLFQKKATRKTTIISTDHLADNKVAVKFNTIAKNDLGEIVENATWQAVIEYEIDKLQANLPGGTRFNFVITDYQLSFLEDNKNK